MMQKVDAGGLFSSWKECAALSPHNQKEEVYNDVTEDVCTFLSQRQAASAVSVAKDNIWIDPGLAYEKCPTQYWPAKGLTVVALGYPVLFWDFSSYELIYQWKYPSYILTRGQMPYLAMLYLLSWSIVCA